MSKAEAVKSSLSSEKQRALENALATIERSHGKGSVMRLGDNNIQNISSISTGSLGLDAALGIGGLPRGRIVEIYGPESSGKCITETTHTLGARGLLTIDELFRIEGYSTSCTNKILPHSVGLLNENKLIENTSHLTWNNRKPVKTIITSIGTVLEPTKNHPIRVMDDNGFIVWRNAGKLAVGDHVVIMRGTECFPSSDVISVDEATLLGFLIADGANAETNQVSFSNSDSDVISEYKLLIKKFAPDLDVNSYPKKSTRTIDHRVFSKSFRSHLARHTGLEYHLSEDKMVPITVRRSGREVQMAFLRAYFELECSLHPEKRSVEVSSASHLLLEQVQLMLLNMGFVGTLSHKPVKGKSYWRLVYSGEDGASLVKQIGFKSDARRTKASEFAESTNRSTNIDSIPNVGRILRSLYDAFDFRSREADDLLFDYIGDTPRANVTYPRLQKIINFFESHIGRDGHPLLTHLRGILEQKPFFASITSIGDDVKPTFDVCLPQTHSFWSNGIISHNTTLALHAIAEAQKNGGICAFIDAEHALDPGYAKKLGVNIDDLLISQPDTGEQALEIANTLVHSGAIDVLVVDSVAALVPRAEIEGEMGDSHVGLHARLMSQALRKMTGDVARSNTLMIMLNQLRQKIGVMFGNPETTTGGNALKFYASVRLDIRRIGAIKNKDDVIGNQTRVKVVKNKMAPPFRQAEFDIMYGQGIRRTAEILDAAVKADIIEKAGAWFSYNSTRIGQGRDNSIAFLDSNPEIKEEIEGLLNVSENPELLAPVQHDPHED